MKVLKVIGYLLLALLVLVPTVLWVGSYFSLDHDGLHTEATLQLPEFEATASAGAQPTLSQIRAGDFTYRARTAGFGNSVGNVILLHGFPESSAMYVDMIPALATAGYQVVAFDQRGYSPGARPDDVAAYTTDKLVADVFAVADAVGFEQFHLVGHDWGAAVGWAAVFTQSERILSWSALSIPHLGAYGEAIATDPDQQSRSAYIGFFQLPFLPEAIFSFNGFNMMKTGVYADHGDETLAEYMALFSEPGALTASLNWYRASELANPEGDFHVQIPTALIWGEHDPVVGESALMAQEKYFQGNLWKTKLDTGHWLMETHVQEVTVAVLENLARITD